MSVSQNNDIPMKKRARAVLKNKTRTVAASVGLYIMLALDLGLLICLITAGSEEEFLACVCVVFALEIVMFLTLLPKPLLQLGIIGKNLGFYIVYAVMPVMELTWGIYCLKYTVGAMVLTLMACRIAAYAVAFLLSRLGPETSGLATMAVAAVALLLLCGASSVFSSPLGNRPLGYRYEEANEYHDSGYVVSRIMDGVRDNVTVPSSYKGEPVVALDLTGEDEDIAFSIPNLVLPESVTYVSMQNIIPENLVVNSPHIYFDRQHLWNGVNTVVFLSDESLPKNLPACTDTATYAFAASLINEAVNRVDFADVRDDFQPIVADDQGYVMYYTDCNLSESGEADDFDCVVTITRNGERVLLPDPKQKLHDDGYEFMGWYDGRDYAQRVEEKDVTGGETYKLFAKYLKLYNVYLYDDMTATEAVQTLEYHNETELTLPTDVTDPEWARDGYAFCGWFRQTYFPYNGEDTKKIEKGSKGDIGFYPVYKKIYNINWHLDGGVAPRDLPNTFHEWSDDISLDSATKSGYTFMGWYTDESFSPGSEISYVPLGVQHDLDIYCKFNLNYTVNLNTDGGRTSWTQRIFHKESGKFYLPSQVDKTGYVFVGWYDNSDFTGDGVSLVDPATEQENKTFYARYVPATYYITYTNGNTSLGEKTVFTYDSTDNTLKENTFFAKTGYNFAGWLINGKVYATGIVTENLSSVNGADLTAEAQWTAVTYTIKFSYGDGTDGGFERTAVYDDDFVFPDCDITREGYRFVGWQIGDEIYAAGDAEENFADTQDAVVEAVAVWEIDD